MIDFDQKGSTCKSKIERESDWYNRKRENESERWIDYQVCNTHTFLLFNRVCLWLGFSSPAFG